MAVEMCPHINYQELENLMGLNRHSADNFLSQLKDHYNDIYADCCVPFYVNETNWEGYENWGEYDFHEDFMYQIEECIKTNFPEIVKAAEEGYTKIYIDL